MQSATHTNIDPLANQRAEHPAVAEQNRRAWNRELEIECEWSRPVTEELVARARQGEWSVRLTAVKPVPKDWFPPMRGLDVLCLASGGGQQVPVLAATGAVVTSFDVSEEQLAKDRELAGTSGLTIRTERGDMTDLSRFDDASFDLVFHPASNLFIQNVQPVWRECHRVLRPGGSLLAGFMNPNYFLFDHDEADATGFLEVKYPMPYSDLTSLTTEEKLNIRKERDTMEFGHMLEDQIGGQLKAGFLLAGFYEDYWSDHATLLNAYAPTSMATRAIKGSISMVLSEG